MKVVPKSKWIYIGGSEGYELIHTVVETSGIRIITWSDSNQETENDPGYSWSGERDDFLQLFKPAPSSQKA